MSTPISSTTAGTNKAGVTTAIGKYDGATAKVVVAKGRGIRVSVGWESRPGIFSTPTGHLSRSQAQCLADTLVAALEDTEPPRVIDRSWEDEPAWRAFVDQNDDSTRGLSDTLAEQIAGDAGHHAGGMFVVSRPLTIVAFSDTVHVKLHDTWGDPADPQEGPILVHIYDADADDPNDDVQRFFVKPDEAARFYLDDATLHNLWVTR